MVELEYTHGLSPCGSLETNLEGSNPSSRNYKKDMMDITKFDEDVLQMLSNAGWNEKRVNPYYLNDTLYLEINKIPVTESIKDFILTFGNLSFMCLNKQQAHTNIFKAINGGDLAWIKYYSKKVKTSLVVIGEMKNRELILCIDDTLSVYSGVDDDFWKLGDSLEESINNLYYGKCLYKI